MRNNTLFGTSFYRNALAAFSLLVLAACGGGGGGGGGTDTGSDGGATPPPVNNPPVARITAPPTGTVGAAISASAASSSDADGDSLVYSWTLETPAGSSATLSDDNGETVSFTPDVTGEFSLRLVASDGKDNSSPATQVITVGNAAGGDDGGAPVAAFNAPVQAVVDTIVEADGSVSSGGNGSPLSYAWTLDVPDGSDSTLVSQTAVTAQFTPDLIGVYTLTLVVSDDEQSSQPTIKTISVSQNANGVVLRITNSKGQAQTNMPVTFGQVFAEGEVENGQALLGKLIESNQTVSLQVDTKATHGDGSLRHAVITAMIPTMGANQTQTLELFPSNNAGNNNTGGVSIDDLLQSNFDATVELNIAGQVYSLSLADLLEQQAEELWLDGQLVREWKVHGAPATASGQAHPHLYIQAQVRAYQNLSAVRVDMAVENAWTYEEDPRNITYNAAIKVKGNTVFQTNDLVHLNHARWRKVFWVDDNDPTASVQHNPAQLIATGALPNYDPSLIYNTSQSRLAYYQDFWQNQNEVYTRKEDGVTYNFEYDKIGPMGIGLMKKTMGNGGAQIWIGPLPRWSSLYLLSQDERAKKVTLGMGDLSGSWSVHYRSKSSNLPVTIDDYPYISTEPAVNTTNPNTGKRELTAQCQGSVIECTRPFRHDTSHQPSFAYVPYLVTGDYYYLEEMQFWSGWNLLHQTPWKRSFNEGLFETQFSTRAQGWVMRNLGFTAYLTPDAHPLKGYFNDKLIKNLDNYTDKYATPVLNEFGVLKPNYSYPTASPWMNDFFTWAIGAIVDMGYDEAKPVLDWKGQFAVERMGEGDATDNDYCWIFGAAYRLVVAPDSNSDYFSSIADVYDATNGLDDVPNAGGSGFNDFGLPCASQAQADALGLEKNEMTGFSHSPTGYPSNLQIALAVAYDGELNGANEAWAKFQARSVKPSYSDYPNYAIVPRKLGGTGGDTGGGDTGGGDTGGGDTGGGDGGDDPNDDGGDGAAEGDNPNAAADRVALANLQPGQWYEIQGSNLSAVFPNPLPDGLNGPRSIMRSWNGGAYDTDTEQLLVWGGGHADYAGNEVYGFDTEDLIWRRLTEPTADTNPGNTPYYSDGLPTQRHTYDSLEYVPFLKSMCALGAGSYWHNSAKARNVDCFNPTTKSWTRYADAPQTEFGINTAYDPTTGLVWQHPSGGGGYLSSFNPQTNTWTRHNTAGTDSWISYPRTGVIDPVARKFLAIGHGDIRIWDLDTDGRAEVFPTTGDTEIEDEQHPGVEYDPVTGLIVAYNGGSDIYTLDVNTAVWTKRPLAANNTVIPGDKAKNGTHGRLRYIPSMNLFIVVNKTSTNVFFYRLANAN